MSEKNVINSWHTVKGSQSHMIIFHQRRYPVQGYIFLQMPCFLGREKIQLPRKWGRNSNGKGRRNGEKEKWKRPRKRGKIRRKKI